MSQTEATRQSDWILPPMASSTGKVANAAVLATSTAVASQDLTLLGFPDSYNTIGTAGNPQACGKYVTVQAEGADAYVLFGKTQASVTGSNAPLQSATGVNVVQLAVYIPAGTDKHFKIPLGDNAGGGYGNDSPARWLAVVTKTGTGVLRVWMSSPQ